MLGAEREFRELLERAYRAHLDAEERLAAAQCAFWIGMTLAAHGDLGQAGGWLARSELLEREGTDYVERGYLLIRGRSSRRRTASWTSAAATAAEAVAVGERFGDPDLVSLGAFAQGSTLIRLGRLREGWRSLTSRWSRCSPARSRRSAPDRLLRRHPRLRGGA